MPNCILVCEDNDLGYITYQELIGCGVNASSIWCGNPESFLAGLKRLVSRRPFQRPSSFTKALFKSGATITHINRPFHASLDAALSKVDGPDVLVCAGSGIIFPRRFLENLQIPAINIHPALLPAYRGPMPTQALILNDDADKYGGVTAHVLVPGIDEGPIIKQYHVRLSDYRNAKAWECALFAKIGDLVREGILPFVNGEIEAIAQDESAASYLSLDQVPRYLSSAMSFEQATKFAQKAPTIYASTKLRYLAADGKAELTRTYGAPEKLGPPTGQLPVAGFFSVEFDLQDARVRIRVDHRIRRLKSKISRARLRLSNGSHPL